MPGRCPVFGTDSNWFPRPHRPADIVTEPFNCALSQQELFDLLTDPAAVEWVHKVDGTSPTRLLLSHQWVFKTDATRKSPDLVTARARAARSVELARSLRVWHPAKTWFILYGDSWHWPCNLTPQLTTLKELGDAVQQERELGRRMALRRRWLKLWRTALILCARTTVKHKLVLPTEAENFGFEEGTDSVFYVDDEVYHFDPVYFIRRRGIWGLRRLEV